MNFEGNIAGSVSKMQNCTVNISEELRAAESKKQALRRSFDIAHEQANSVLKFTVQWKDFEKHFDLSKKSLEKQSNDVDMKIMLLDQRAKEIESKESDLVLVEKRIKECDFELACKQKELDLVQKMIGECDCELQLKESELNLLSVSLDLKREELSLVQESVNSCQVDQKKMELLKNLLEKCCDEIELKEKKLGEVQRLVEERERQIALKDSKIYSIQSMIEEYEEELKAKEKSYDEVKKSLRLCETKLECKKKELERTQSSIKELLVQFNSEDEKLESFRRRVRQRENEVESIERELDSMKKKQKKYSDDIGMKEREYNGLKKEVEDLSQELASKDKLLKIFNKSIEECSREFQVKKEELSTIKSEIVECSDEVELKRNELNLIHHASNKLQFDLIQTMEIGYLRKLKEKEKLFDSLKKGLEDHFQDLEVKERLFEKRVKDFEIREKEFDSIQKTVEGQGKNLELQVKIEEQENLTSKGRNLQLLLNQHLQKHDLIFSKIFNKIKRARDPASLVLDAMSGFYPPHSSERDVEFQVGLIRRSCILLLEQLLTVAQEINAQVRDEALKVAGQWKKKMRVGVENSLEVLGFLHLLAAYRLASAFDGNELESLLLIVAQHRQTPKLRRSLGFADKVTDPQRSTATGGRSSLPMLVGISAHTYQPVPSPRNQPQYSGANQSTSTSSPRVQPKLQNHDSKRPRRESPTFRACTLQTPASVARSGGQARFGPLASNHSRVTANMGAAQSHVAGKPNLYYFEHKHF